MNARIAWTELLARPVMVHERTLRLASKEAAGPISGALEPVITGTDEALAALSILRGPEAFRAFPDAIASVVARLGREIEMFRDGIADRSVLGFLSLVAISEAIGAPLELPGYDVDHRFKRFVSNKVFSRTEKATVALLALNLGRVKDAQLIIQTDVRRASTEPGADPMMLVKALVAAKGAKSNPPEAESAFDAFVRGFPAALSAEAVEWRQLMLAAVLVIGKLGGTPIAEVADAMHRWIEKLAAEESA